jgi:hypothetical protein
VAEGLVPAGKQAQQPTGGARGKPPSRSAKAWTLDDSPRFKRLVAADCQPAKLRALFERIIGLGAVYGYQKEVRAAGGSPWSRRNSLLKATKSLPPRLEDLAEKLDRVNSMLPPSRGYWFGPDEPEGRSALPALPAALRNVSRYLRSSEYQARAESVRHDFKREFFQAERRLVLYVERASQRTRIKVEPFATLSALIKKIFKERGHKPPVSYERKAFMLRVKPGMRVRRARTKRARR